MPIDTDLNISPYYDDYDENKDYHRVLFRPAVPLQAREITQLQTILQQQIERFGQFQFKEGTIIKGCAFTFDNSIKYAKLFDKTSAGTDVNVNLFGKNDYIRSAANLIAQIVDTRGGLESQNPYLNTLFFKYINSGTNKETAYEAGNVLEIYPSATSIASITVDNAGSGYTNNDTAVVTSSLHGSGFVGNVVTDANATTINRIEVDSGGSGYTISDHPTISITSSGGSNFTGTVNLTKTANVTIANTNFEQVGNSEFNVVGSSYQMKVEDGVIFQKGNFQRFATQDIIVSPYTKRPHEVSVGVVTSESVVNSSVDTTLLDNASGYSNENAPGADRLKLQPVLTVNTTAIAESSNNFLQLVKFQNGQKIAMNQQPVLGQMGEELANRTYEESGDYVVDPFSISTEGISGNTTHLSGVVGAGIGYVRGRRFQTVGPTRISIPKATANTSKPSQTVSASFGHYVIVNELVGQFSHDNNDQILILDAEMNALSSNTNPTIPAQSSNSVSMNGVTGNVIGTARIRSLEQDSDIEGKSTSEYNAYLYDIKMYTGKSFKKHAKGIYHYAGTEHPAGNNNTAYRGIADLVSSDIKDPTFNKLVFKLGQSGISAVGNANYIRKATIDGQLAGAGTISLSRTGNEEFNFGQAASTLNETLEKEIVIIARGDQDAASAVGSGGIVSGTNTIVTSSATGTLTEGDFVKVGSDKRQITQVINSTSFAVNKAMSAATGLSVTKHYPNNHVIPLGDRSGATASVSNSGKTLTINIGQALAGTLNVSVIADIKDTAQPGLAKTLSTSLVKIDLSSNDGGTSGPWCLGIPDGLSLDKVYVHTGYTESATYDKTSDFELDNGQKDGYYGLSYLKLKSNSRLSLSSGQKITVALKHFNKDTSSGKTGFYTYQSYDAIIDDASPAANEIRTQEIPVFVSPTDGSEYSLRDSIDFRPNMAATATKTSTLGSATINPSAVESIDTDNNTVSPNQLWFADITYYLPRKDRLVITRNGFELIKGIPSTDPQYPPKPDESMQLATIDVPVFPSLDTVNARYYKRPGLGVKVRATQLKRYSMQDIKQIEQRVNNLEYYTSLNMLEKMTGDETLPGRTDPTLNRFKNGFIVDNFSSKTTGNPLNDEFKAGYDSARKLLTPKFEVYSLKLKQEAALNRRTATKGDITTIAYAQQAIINQPTATQTRRCTSAFWEYNGQLKLYPDYVSDVDHTKSPESAVQIDVDVASPTLALIDELNKVAPTQMTSDEVISESITTNLTGTSSSDTVRTDTFETVVAQQIERTTTNFAATTSTTTKKVGDFVTDISFQPYIPSIQIRFVATGLRPNLDHYTFFDNVRVREHTAPATLTTSPANISTSNAAESIKRSGSANTVLTSNSSGGLAGIINVPGGTFFAGERKVVVADIQNLEQIDSMVSHATARFNCFNFSVESGDISISTRSTIPTSSTSRRVISSSETTTTQTHTTIPANTTPAANTDPITTPPDDDESSNNDVIVVGNTVTVNAVSNAISNSAANTVTELERPQVVECWDWVDERDWWGWEGAGGGWWWDPEPDCFPDGEDPLCQTFLIEKGSLPQKSSSGYLTALDLFFSSKDPVLGAEVELREVHNGTPAAAVLPFSQVTLKSSDVSTSTNGTVATRVDFKSPVVVQAGMEYAIVIKPEGNSPEYSVFTSKAGQTELNNSSKQVNQDWGRGTMFLSTNDRTWTAYIDEDMKFKVYAAVFKHNNAQVELVNEDYEWFTANNFTINGSFKDGEEIFKLTSNAAGTVSISEGTSTLTGTSTTFADLGLTSGDKIVLSGNTTTFDVVEVDSVANNTSLTLKGAPTFTDSSGNYMITPTAVFDRLDANTTTIVVKDSSAKTGSLFANGDTIVGTTSIANTQIGQVVDTNISYFEPQMYRSTPVGTSVVPRITVGSSTEQFKFNDRNYPSANLVVMSKSNEIVNNSGNKSLKVTQTLSTKKQGIAPSIDLQSQGLTIYENVINNDTTNEHLTSTGSASAKYVSRTVSLAKDLDAEDIKVFLNAYKPQGTDVKVYAKILNSADSESFADKAWSELDSVGPNKSLVSSGVDRNDVVEYEFGFKPSPNATAKAGKAITLLNNTTVDGSGTDYQTDFNSGDLIKIVNTNSDTDYIITSVVGEPASDHLMTVADPIPFASTGAEYFKVDSDFVNQAYQDPKAPEAFQVSYYNGNGEKFVGYSQLAIKIVMTSTTTNIAPYLKDYRAIAVSL